MRLIQKTNLFYLMYTFIVFSIGAIFFYFLVKKVLIDGIDEILHGEKLQLIENLNYEKDIQNLKSSPNIDINIRKVDQENEDEYTTVSLLNLNQEYTNYRQLDFVFAYQNKFYEIKIRQSLAEVETLTNSILPLELLLLIIIFVGIIFIGKILSQTTWVPLYELLDKLKSYNVEQIGIIKHKVTHIDEIDALGESVEKMTTKITKDFNSQKEFNENSAHELQTPIAIVKNKLELLIQSPNLNESDMELLSGVFEALKRLSSVNKGLLLLSKIDNHQFSAKKEIDIQKKIDTLIEYFKESIDEQNILVTKKVIPTILKSNDVLIEILLSNLISNAIKHNLKNGTLTIELDNNKLTIYNTGMPPKAETESLFGRFKKESRLDNSVGLGLAISRKVCDYLNFTISYQYKNNIHSLKVVF